MSTRPDNPGKNIWCFSPVCTSPPTQWLLYTSCSHPPFMVYSNTIKSHVLWYYCTIKHVTNDLSMSSKQKRRHQQLCEGQALAKKWTETMTLNESNCNLAKYMNMSKPLFISQRQCFPCSNYSGCLSFLITQLHFFLFVQQTIRVFTAQLITSICTQKRE